MECTPVRVSASQCESVTDPGERVCGGRLRAVLLGTPATADPLMTLGLTPASDPAGGQSAPNPSMHVHTLWCQIDCHRLSSC